jgi:hypothetical protein
MPGGFLLLPYLLFHIVREVIRPDFAGLYIPTFNGIPEINVTVSAKYHNRRFHKLLLKIKPPKRGL